MLLIQNCIHTFRDKHIFSKKMFVLLFTLVWYCLSLGIFHLGLQSPTSFTTTQFSTLQLIILPAVLFTLLILAKKSQLPIRTILKFVICYFIITALYQFASLYASDQWLSALGITVTIGAIFSIFLLLQTIPYWIYLSVARLFKKTKSSVIVFLMTLLLSLGATYLLHRVLISMIVDLP